MDVSMPQNYKKDRRVFVKAPPIVDEYELYKLFSQFGRIHNIIPNKHKIENFEIHYGCVTDELLHFEIDEIMIDGKVFRFRFEEFDECDEEKNFQKRQKLSGSRTSLVDHGVLAPSKESSYNILHTLNDDCLLHIFNELNVSELCELGIVCERFNEIAQQTFKSKCRRQGVWPIDDPRKIWPNLSLSHMDFFLQTVGAEIRTLNVHCTDINTTIQLRMCAEYCPNIEVLSFRDANWDASSQNDICRLLPRLKELTLTFDFYQRCSIGTMFVGDWPLEKLEINGRIDWETSEIRVPKLMELSLITPQKVKREKSIIRRSKLTMGKSKQHLSLESLSGLPQIRRLNLEYFVISPYVLELLPSYLPKCQELRFFGCDVDIHERARWDEWHEFKSLAALYVHFSQLFPMKKMLRSLATINAPLKRLTFDMPEPLNDDFVHQFIIPLEQLEVITFVGPIPDIDMNNLMRSMDRLSAINFQCFRITAYEIRHIIRQIISRKSITGRPLDHFSIRITAHRLDFLEEDCNEITEMLQTCPEIRFMVVASGGGDFGCFENDWLTVYGSLVEHIG